MHTLRLYLASAEEVGDLPWSVLDAHGRMTASGRAEDPWPASEETELILAAGLTRFTRVDLPAGVRLSHGATLGFALEDGLINEPADNLYVAGEMLADGGHMVALTAAAPLYQVSQALRARDRHLARIVPEELLLPQALPGQWTLAQCADGWLLRQSGACGMFVPGRAPGLVDASYCSEAPQALMVCAGSAVPEHLARLPRQSVPAHDWRAAAAAAPVDFAYGVLAGRPLWRLWRPVLLRLAWVMLLLVCAESLLNLGEASWLAWRKVQLSAEIASGATRLGVRAESPGEALRLAGGALDAMRLEHGGAARDGALNLMAALEPVMGEGLRLSSLDYRDGRLSFVAGEVSPEQFERWRLLLAERRLRLSGNPGGQMKLEREGSA